MRLKQFALSSLFAALPASLLAAQPFGFSDDGISIESGGEKLCLSYPRPLDSAKKEAKIAARKLSGSSASIEYEGGGKADLELGQDGFSLKASGMPSDVKSFHMSMIVKPEYGSGGSWAAGEGEAKPFPSEKPPKPFLYQGSVKSFSLTSPSGAKAFIELPDYSYQQLQDNREWNSNLFQWQCWIPFNQDAGGFSVRLSRPQQADAGHEGTEILKWKDGKKAVFMLEFDDSCETHVKNVVPELKKRGMVGTFYIVPGTGPCPFANQRNAWEKEIPLAGMEYGNHTLTHKGVKSAEELDVELAKCGEEIDKCFPDRKKPRLVSFGQPGGVPWTVSKDEVRQALAKYNLVDRPPFFGYPMHIKTKEELLKFVDQAVEKGEMAHIDFHGVGGDWLVTPMDVFLALLDKLESRRDQLWITDPVSWHKYLTERKGAEIQILESGKDAIRLKLTAKTDPALYDMPLTLSTKLPESWKSCEASQGGAKLETKIVDGAVRYQAMPDGAEIILKPSK